MKNKRGPVVLWILLLWLSSATASAQICSQDADCPGQLICDGGICVSQSGAPAVGPASVGSPPAASAVAPTAPSAPAAQRAVVPARAQPKSGYPELRAGGRPEKLDYDSTLPIPDGYHLTTRRHRALVITGTILFAVGHAAAVTFAGMLVASDSGTAADGAEPLFAPLVGPFIGMATNSVASENSTWMAIYGVDGAMQITGATLLTLGLAIGQPILVRGDDTALRWTIVPQASREVAGLAWTGRF